MGNSIYTGGTFDLFHAGHVKFLERCRKIAGDDGRVTVSLNTDAFVQRYKKTPPIYNLEQRTQLVSACRYVDNVIVNSGCEDSSPAISVTEPDLIVIGSDWATKDYLKQLGIDQGWLDDRGIGLVYVPYTRGVSTTYIKSIICDHG